MKVNEVVMQYQRKFSQLAQELNTELAVSGVCIDGIRLDTYVHSTLGEGKTRVLDVKINITTI